MTETLIAADVVAELTRVELESIAADVAAGRLEHQLKSLDERGTGHLLVRNQYSGRYPFELLQNAADAAADADHAGQVRFHLSNQALLVADNGIGISGFRPENLSHGLAGMRQRARALGGTFDVRTAPGQGTRVEAFFPLETAEQAAVADAA